MIKTRDRTPDIYSRESRDFQLFGHLFDAAFNSSKIAIDSMKNNQGTTNIDNRFVDLMNKTIGFDFHGSYSAKELIYVIRSFKTLVKNKGTRFAIESAIKVLISSQGIKESFYIPEDNWTNGDMNLNIFLPDATKHITLLEELFDYILPAGWTYSLIIKSYGSNESIYTTDIISTDTQRRKKTGTTEGIIETELARSNYIVDDAVTDLHNIGQVPDDETSDMVSPAVNIGTVLTDKNQINKYNKK